jgi:hypothetical protein
MQSPMGTRADIAAALAAMADDDLESLRMAIEDESIFVPQLRHWLATAIGAESARRSGTVRDVPDPRGVIGAEDAERSLVALAILHSALRPFARIAHFLDVTADVLCTRG